MNYSNIIVSSKEIIFGKPRVNGTRISVQQVLAYLSQGYSFKEIIQFHPELKERDIKACIDYANDLVSSIKIVTPFFKTAHA